jgi:CIC family chloride channel protein
VDEDETFLGHILMDDVRNIMFDTDLYDTTVENLMVKPQYIIDPGEPMAEVAHKFQESGKYNIPVVHKGRYLGYVSRANVFSTYRRKLSEISDD